MERLLFAYCLCVEMLYNVALGGRYGYQMDLDYNGHYHLEWSVNYATDTVYFRLTVAKSTPISWFAVGFSDYGELTNADLVAYWTDVDNNHHFVDSHTNAYGILAPDSQQDYHVSAVTSLNGGLTMEFYRLFNTNDINDYSLDAHFTKLSSCFTLESGTNQTHLHKAYLLQENGTTHCIHVESTSQSESPFGHDVTHLPHGLQRAQILKPILPKVIFPKDTWTFEVRAPEVLVPAEETTYWWHTTILPPLPHPLHIIKYEGIISEGSEDFVHHMEVFHCEVSPDQQIPNFNGPGLSEGKPKGLEVCRKVIGAWAMGAQPLVYPEEAGVPIGGANFSRYAILEIHFNNPRKKAGHMDRSGIRFYVTSQLRQFDAGIMELGLEYTNKMAIPPRQKAFPLTGFCVSECTNLALPPQGIRVFASQLHTHLTGKRTFTRHFRNTKELPELNRDDHYSPHFQEIRQLPQPVVVLPGDLLVHTCEYDTTSRKKATVGGYAISDEMCVNYVHYYPKTELEVCKSSVETIALNEFFVDVDRAGLSKLHAESGDRAMYTSIHWNHRTTNFLKHLYDTSPLSMQCNKSDGQRFPGQWSHFPIPRNIIV